MSTMNRAVIALGSNLGDRVGNLLAAIKALSSLDIQLSQLSRLYESAPAYVTDQPAFLNAAALVDTPLPPLQLLRNLKQIEAALGRDFGGQRFGPRPIDLDIVFYEDHQVREGERLVVPHPRWQERDFVKAPLADLAPAQGAGAPRGVDASLALARQLWDAAGGGAQLGTPALRCVMPMGRLGVWAWQGRTQVMGILNVTPDSFSDGGRAGSVSAAVRHACAMAEAGADVIDVGGQSTRPGATLLTPAQEAARVLPVLRALAQEETTAALPLSVDTFYAEVAEAAVEAGATMVNDVSGGGMDPGMVATVARLGVPYVAMHMRGTPATMQSREHTQYADTCADVAAELRGAALSAVAAGVEPWRLVLDPGLGFAKTVQGNVDLMAGLARLRGMMEPPLRGLPMLVGPSRKGFLGKLTGREAPDERDFATAAAAALCVANGAAIVRAHNVAAARDAVRVADAVVAAQQHKATAC